MSAGQKIGFISRWAYRLRRIHVQAWMRAGRARGGEIKEQKFAAAVLKLDRIGDFVLALSAIRLVMRRFGEERCALVISPGVEMLARREFPMAALIVVPAFLRHKRAFPHWWCARKILSGVACVHLVCLRHQRWDYDELAVAWIRADTVHLVHDPKSLAWVVGRRSLPLGADLFSETSGAVGLCRELELHRCVLQSVLGDRPDADDVLPRFEHARASSSQSHAVIVPFSSARVKDVPAELLRAVTSRDGRGADQKLFLVGSPAERARLERCAATLKSDSSTRIEVVTPADLNALVDLIAAAKWVFTADTAAAHIATALDRPTVGVLGGGHFGQFGPWWRSSRQRWITHSLPCFNCGWHCRFPEPWCLTRITGGEALEALRAVTSQAEGLEAK